jgi:hypothetical protein
MLYRGSPIDYKQVQNSLPSNSLEQREKSGDKVRGNFIGLDTIIQAVMNSIIDINMLKILKLLQRKGGQFLNLISNLRTLGEGLVPIGMEFMYYGPQVVWFADIWLKI